MNVTAELWGIARTGIGMLGIVGMVAVGLVGSPVTADADESEPAISDDYAADFTLTDTDGNRHTLSSYLKDGKPVVLEWFNPFCPYVQRYHKGDEVDPSLREAYQFASEHGVVWLAINSNAPGKQGSGLEVNKEKREEYGMDYPLLLDEQGTVGRAYGVTNTPQLFIISPDREVIYDGGADDTVLRGQEPTVNYVINALTQYFAGEDIDPARTPHPGCSVKYNK